MSILTTLLSNFRFYRKRKGGRWYKVREYDVSGFAGPFVYWTREQPAENEWAQIIDEENY